jgi:hypothetical protein
MKCDGGGDGVADRRFRADVAGDGLSAPIEAQDFIYGVVRVGLGFTIGDGDVSAGTRKNESDLTANAPGASCDKGRFSVQSEGVHGSDADIRSEPV